MELFSSSEVAAGALEDTISISAEICVIAHVGVVCSQRILLPDKTLFSLKLALKAVCMCSKIASGRHTHIFCYKLCATCAVYRILIPQYVVLCRCLAGILIAIHGAGLCANTNSKHKVFAWHKPKTI